MAAMTSADAVMFIPNQPIGPLLGGANEIVVRTPDTRFGILLNRERMAGLMAALDKCRAAIGR
jgi:hypothetical protein